MNELEQARREISEADEEIAQLFEKRMNAVRKVAAYKKERGLPVFDPAREEELIRKNSARVSDPELRGYYVNFLRINGEVLWSQGNNDYRFGPDWREKPGTPSAMTPQLSGCMLVEALAVLERNGLLND